MLKPTRKMNKTCIIIHGCPADESELLDTNSDDVYFKHWIPWTKEKLLERGIDTITPLMPTPWQPDYLKFKKEFEKYNVDENTVLIGHSCGCAFLVRWLGESKQKINKLILVAPWKIARKNDKFRENFYTYSIDPTINDRVQEIIMFTSDNEERDGKISLEIFKKAIGGEVIELKGRGHYTFEHMVGTIEFPELLERI
jgi:predicted alpha/beta hydrolase family esterase